MATAKQTETELRRNLAENLRRFRQHQGLSQEAFADLCRLHRTYVGAIERSERNVTLGTLVRFATVTGMSVPDLLTRSDGRRD
jgi:transcriptional regulator with XRE-family HTH domain